MFVLPSFQPEVLGIAVPAASPGGRWDCVSRLPPGGQELLPSHWALGNFPTPPEISSSSMCLWAYCDIPEGQSPVSTREVSLWPLTKEAFRRCLAGKGPAALHRPSIPQRLVGDGISHGSDACPPFFLPFRMNQRSFLGTWVALLVMTVRHRG